MKKQFFYGLIALCCTGLYACKSSAILSATFEIDAIHHPPATNLAGAPSGDMIQYNPALNPQLKVENSSTAGEKALHFINASVTVPSESDRWVNFRGIATHLVNTIWFTHVATNENATGDILIDVSDGGAHLIARMRIQADGEVGLAKNITDVYTDHIGKLGRDQHTIIFTVMPSSLTYNVTIFQTSGHGITALDKPMITRNALEFANPAHPSISFQHASTSDGSHKYIIESVTISRKKPN